MNSTNNRSIDMKPNHVKNSDFMSLVYSKPLREYKKPKFGIGDRIPISKYDVPFRKGYRTQFTREICEIVAIAAEKRPTYTIKDEQEAVIRGKFYVKELIRVIWVWILLHLSWFSTHIRSSLQTIRSVLLQLFSGAREFGWTMGFNNFQDLLLINIPKSYRGENYILRWETFENK